jgi:hypothetical protein
LLIDADAEYRIKHRRLHVEGFEIFTSVAMSKSQQRVDSSIELNDKALEEQAGQMVQNRLKLIHIYAKST